MRKKGRRRELSNSVCGPATVSLPEPRSALPLYSSGKDARTREKLRSLGNVEGSRFQILDAADILERAYVMADCVPDALRDAYPDGFSKNIGSVVRERAMQLVCKRQRGKA